MNTNSFLRFLVLVFIQMVLCLSVGCTPTKKDVVGTYVRARQGVRETLTLQSDFTFQQKVEYADGRSWVVDDKWTLVNRSVQLGRYYQTYDTVKGSFIDPPEMYYAEAFEWTYHWLCRDLEPGWRFVSQGSTEALRSEGVSPEGNK